MYAYGTKDVVKDGIHPVGQKVRKDMVRNTDGRGFTFAVSDATQLRRFLVIGAANHFYAGEGKIVDDNAAVVRRLIDAGHADEVLNEIVEVSDSGLSAQNDYALFALALVMVHGDIGTKLLATAINGVARIGTHRVHLAKFIKNMGGWNKKKVRDAFALAYKYIDNEDLLFDAMKYQSRDGWSQGDVLRLAHPRPVDEVQDAIFCWMVYGFNGPKSEKNEFGKQRVNKFLHVKSEILDRLYGYEELRSTTDVNQAVKLIERWRLPRECVPTTLLNSVEVWEALLPHMGLGAMTRNLATMMRVGLFQGNSVNLGVVLGAITDQEKVKKSRLHPLNVLLALRTYAGGTGFRSDKTWTPIDKIVEALNDTFYATFDYIESTGKKIRYAIDVSGSMDSNIYKVGADGWSHEGTELPITNREFVACMAMASARRETNYEIVGFSHRLVNVPISPSMRLDQVLKVMQNIPMGSTDISLAYTTNHQFDAFVVLTDNEVNTGGHPFEVLKKYRGIHGPAKAVVCGTTATAFTVADPNDLDSLDIAGFDPTLPSLISNFISGKI